MLLLFIPQAVAVYTMYSGFPFFFFFFFLVLYNCTDVDETNLSLEIKILAYMNNE